MISNTFVAHIDPSLQEKLELDLEEQGFEFSRPQYTLFSAKKKGVIVTLYESGKLVVQGKDKKEFIEFYLEPEILHSLAFSHPHAHTDLRPRIGVDEAGKGDFFGPLCIGGVFADEKGIQFLIDLGVRDSKTIVDTQIHKLADQIRKNISFDVVSIFPEKYNELYDKFHNLNKLLGWGHSKVIENLHHKTKCRYVIIDQFADESIVENAVRQKELDLKLTQRTKGEADIVVAAASILARDAFVRGLSKLEEQFETSLPKGASKEVHKALNTFVSLHGKEMLRKVGKLHFKTANEIT